MQSILVLGTGSWGTAISQVICDNLINEKVKINMYGRDQSEIDEINNYHSNSRFFGGILNETDYLNHSIRAFNDLQEAIDSLNGSINIIINALPTKAVKNVLIELSKFNLTIIKPIKFINLSKGYDDNDGSIKTCFRSIFNDTANFKYYSLLGPSHAEEVIQKKLTCINLIPEEKTYITSLIDLFTTDYFKVHLIEDLQAAEFYSSIKNVYALMSGILNGLGYGQNARAALLTYSLYEMRVLSKALNFDENSLFGLSGIGDLVVTCYSNDSRNFTAGNQIGEFNSFKEFLRINNRTVEGLRACHSIYSKMDELGLDLVIIKTAYKILYNYIEPKQAVIDMFDLFNHQV